MPFDMESLMKDPNFVLGLNILGGSKGSYGGFGQQLGTGFKNAQGQLQTQEKTAQQKLMNNLQMQQAKAKAAKQAREEAAVAEQAALREQYISKLPADEQGLARAYPSQFGESLFKEDKSYAPVSVIGPDGKPTLVRRKDSFGRTPTPKPALVNIEKQKQIPTREEILRGDLLNRAAGSRKYVDNLYTGAREGGDRLADIDRMTTLLETVKTGKGQDMLLSARQLAKTLGMKVDIQSIADAEELQVRFGDEVMRRVAETKGAVSEKEMDLFREYSANYGKTPEGNRAILAFARAKIMRNRDMANLARKLEDEGKTSIEIERAMNDYMDTHSISDMLKPPGERQIPESADLTTAQPPGGASTSFTPERIKRLEGKYPGLKITIQ